ncbi:MAG: hypothetical protein ACLRSL_04360 [Streptococcus sp.]
MALELPNGETVTGKTSDLFGPTAKLFSSTPSRNWPILIKKPS